MRQNVNRFFYFCVKKLNENDLMVLAINKTKRYQYPTTINASRPPYIKQTNKNP